MSPNDETPVLRRLALLDSCVLSDALDALSMAGCVTGLAPVGAPARICGRVHTVKLVAGPAPDSRAAPRHLGSAAIEASAPGELIVIEQRTGLDAACWGGILSRAARIRGVLGVIADGPVRDVDEARELAFPLYGRSVTARTARGRIHEAGTDIPVEIAGVTVQPGDYALADASAVVFVPQGRIGAVLEVAEAIAAREAAMIGRLAEGRPVTEVMGAEYEQLLGRASPRGRSA